MSVLPDYAEVLSGNKFFSNRLAIDIKTYIDKSTQRLRTETESSTNFMLRLRVPRQKLPDIIEWMDNANVIVMPLNVWFPSSTELVETRISSEDYNIRPENKSLKHYMVTAHIEFLDKPLF